MRFSFVLAAIVGAAALLPVINQPAEQPVKGAVVEEQTQASNRDNSGENR